MALYFDFIPNEIIIESILPHLKMLSMIQVITFNDREYEDIFRIKFNYAYNILKKSTIRFTCKPPIWKEMIETFAVYENASVVEEDPFDILSYYYIRYLIGKMNPIDSLELESWGIALLIRSVIYRDHKDVSLDAIATYPQAFAVDLYKEVIFLFRGNDHLVSIALINGDVGIFEIMMKDIYIMILSKPIPSIAIPIFQTPNTYQGEDITGIVIRCSYLDFNDEFLGDLLRRGVTKYIASNDTFNLNMVFNKYKGKIDAYLGHYLLEAAAYNKSIIPLILNQEGNITSMTMIQALQYLVCHDAYATAKLVINDRRFPIHLENYNPNLDKLILSTTFS